MFTAKTKRRLIFWAAAIIVLLFLIWLFSGRESPSQPQWGVTFSARQAEALNLDWRETYQAILDDLGVRHLRLAAYWDTAEPFEGQFDFSEIDYQLNEARKRNVEVILAVGRKLPRWPECHIPQWAEGLQPREQEEKIIKMIEAVVSHSQAFDNIVAWQVENEPLLFFFGECPDHSLEFLQQEVELVRSLDNRPIVITESGELSTWLRTVGLADILGISLYRTVFSPLWGYFVYPLTPSVYIRHAELIGARGNQVIISELQAEPWGDRPTIELTREEQYRSFNQERFEEVIDFARRTGFPQVYLWGVEYWYYLKQAGENYFWDRAKQLFGEPNS